MNEQIQPGYRALFALPGVPRLIASMVLARIAGQMSSLIIVLFALERYGSPAVAGAATFLAVAPAFSRARSQARCSTGMDARVWSSSITPSPPCPCR